MIKTFLLSIVITVLLFIPRQAYSYEIYPVPQQQAVRSAEITFTPIVNLVLTDNINDITANRAKEVLTKANIDFVVSDCRSDNMTDIVIGTNVAGDVALECVKQRLLDLSVFPDRDCHHDPYMLSVAGDDSDGLILIIGDSAGSAFYGLATLEQMLEQRVGNRLNEVDIIDYAAVKMRGIVEGFYGFPYPVETRLNILDFCKRYKLNTYVYGPKGDPYHAGNWRLGYPETITEEQKSNGVLTRSDVAQLARKAHECGVDLVYSVHPALQGGGINFYNLDPGVEDIMAKFADMYALGVRHFGVSVDDMSGHPSTQGQLATKVQEKLDEAYNTESTAPEDRVGGLLFVPTGYALNYSGAASVLSQFATVSSNINVAFTGYDCFSNIRESSFNAAAEYLNRKPIFWWNNPVNDDYDDFLYMHGLTQRWTIETSGVVTNMGGLLMNPMNQAGPSKIALFNGADYSWNPEKFDAEKSWDASIPSIMNGSEYGDALAVFINMVSAYSTVETGGSDKSRPNGFNSCKKQAPEGEKYAGLFNQFRNTYTAANMPDAGNLRKVLDNAIKACEKLHELEYSSNPDHYLFYNDMRPWFLKIERMCQLSDAALSLMTGMASETALDNWTNVSNIAEEIRSYHDSEDFLVHILEGTTSPRVVSIEALPAPRDFEPFVDWLADVVGDYSVSLPQRNRDMQVISNLDDFSSVKLIRNEGSYTLSCSSEVELGQGEYTGVYLNYIYDINLITPDLTEGLCLQYSVNGKTWIDFDNELGEPVTAAYLRLINRGDKLTVSGNLFSFALSSIAGNDTPSLSVSTNMGTYSSYSLTNLLDGNPSTFYWSSGAPKAGQSYIRVDMGGEFTLSDVKLYFCKNDRPAGEVALQLSSDGITWSTVTSFTKSDITDDVYTYLFSGEKARYVQMFYLTVPSAEWVQLAEFEVNCATEAVGLTEVAVDNQGVYTSVLDDRSLTTYYAPQNAGYIDYTVIENINVESVEIYHKSDFVPDADLPKIKIFADGEWHLMGDLDKCRTIVDTRNLKNISMVRIEWNDTNRPVLHQIMPIGTPYIEYPEQLSGVDDVEMQSDIVVKCMADNRIYVAAPQEISSVIITDLLGRVINTIKPMACETIVDVQHDSMVIVSVTVADKTYTTKLIVK